MDWKFSFVTSITCGETAALLALVLLLKRETGPPVLVLEQALLSRTQHRSVDGTREKDRAAREEMHGADRDGSAAMLLRRAAARWVVVDARRSIRSMIGLAPQHSTLTLYIG